MFNPKHSTNRGRGRVGFAGHQRSDIAMGIFERYLSVWVALCIALGSRDAGISPLGGKLAMVEQ